MELDKAKNIMIKGSMMTAVEFDYEQQISQTSKLNFTTVIMLVETLEASFHKRISVSQ